MPPRHSGPNIASPSPTTHDDSADIADPMGRWNLHYRRTAKQLEHLIEATLDGLFGKRSG